jgi:hypothetical protein
VACDLLVEALESVNNQLENVAENRGDVPNGGAAIKSPQSLGRLI